MKKMLLILSAFVCLTSATPARVAADCCDVNPCCDPCFDPCCGESNFYVGILGGANWIQNTRRHFGHKLEFDTGYAVGGVVGYRLGGLFGSNVFKGLRAEFEVTYRENELKRFEILTFDDITFTAPQRFDAKFRSTAYMVNAIYDITIPCWSIMPYLGVGIGYETQKFNLGHFDETLFPVGVVIPSSFFHHHRHKGDGFAWQVIAGIGYNFNAMFDIDLDYRFNHGQHKDLYNHTLSVVAKYHF